MAPPGGRGGRGDWQGKSGPAERSGKGDDRGGKGQKGHRGGRGDRHREEDQDGEGKRREGKGRGKGHNEENRAGGWNREPRDRRGRGGEGWGGGSGDWSQQQDAPESLPAESCGGGEDAAAQCCDPPPAEKPARTPLWTEYADVDGLPYYYNSRTGLSQWERPAELSPSKPALSISSTAPETSSGAVADVSISEKVGKDNFGRRDRDADRDDKRKGDGGRDGGGGREARPGRGGRRNKGRPEDNSKKDITDFGPPGCNLFVFHLPDDWTDDDLHEYFAPHGNVVSAKVMKELGTGRSRGFGFVSYEDRVSAATAIKKMQGYKILGKRLKVEFKKGEGEDEKLEDEDAGAQKKSYPDDERLIGYLRAISAKNVVQSLKASDGGAGGDFLSPPLDDEGD